MAECFACNATTITACVLADLSCAATIDDAHRPHQHQAAAVLVQETKTRDDLLLAHLDAFGWQTAVQLRHKPAKQQTTATFSAAVVGSCVVA